MSTVGFWLISIVFVLIVLGIITGFFGVISQAHRGNNWGHGHMRDLGLEDDQQNKDLKPF